MNGLIHKDTNRQAVKQWNSKHILDPGNINVQDTRLQLNVIYHHLPASIVITTNIIIFNSRQQRPCSRAWLSTANVGWCIILESHRGRACGGLNSPITTPQCLKRWTKGGGGAELRPSECFCVQFSIKNSSRLYGLQYFDFRISWFFITVLYILRRTASQTKPGDNLFINYANRSNTTGTDQSEPNVDCSTNCTLVSCEHE